MSFLGAIAQTIGSSVTAGVTQNRQIRHDRAMAALSQQYALESQQNAFNHEKEMMTLQNQYNSALNQRKLREQAGLSPYEMDNGGYTSTASSHSAPSPSGSASASQLVSPDMSALGRINLLDDMSAIAQIKNINADIDLKNKQANKESAAADELNASAALAREQTQNYKLRNAMDSVDYYIKLATSGDSVEQARWATKAAQAGYEKILADTDLTKEMKNKTVEETALLAVQQYEVSANIALLRARTAHEDILSDLDAARIREVNQSVKNLITEEALMQSEIELNGIKYKVEDITYEQARDYFENYYDKEMQLRIDKAWLECAEIVSSEVRDWYLGVKNSNTARMSAESQSKARRSSSFKDLATFIVMAKKLGFL